jgi:hypothetical protein
VNDPFEIRSSTPGTEAMVAATRKLDGQRGARLLDVAAPILVLALKPLLVIRFRDLDQVHRNQDVLLEQVGETLARVVAVEGERRRCRCPPDYAAGAQRRHPCRCLLDRRHDILARPDHIVRPNPALAVFSAQLS